MILNGYIEKFFGLLTGLCGRIYSLFGSLIPLKGAFTPEKKRILVFVMGGFVSLFLLIMIASLFLRQANTGSTASQRAAHSIPVEELFYPNEPDFAPVYLLEREPRQFWSFEDISPYWRSPGNPDFWRGEVKTAIDLLMEGVP